MLYAVLRDRFEGKVINRGCHLAWVKREGGMKTKDPVQGVLLAEGGLFSGARGNLDYWPQP